MPLEYSILEYTKIIRRHKPALSIEEKQLHSFSRAKQ